MSARVLAIKVIDREIGQALEDAGTQILDYRRSLCQRELLDINESRN